MCLLQQYEFFEIIFVSLQSRVVLGIQILFLLFFKKVMHVIPKMAMDSKGLQA